MDKAISILYALQIPKHKDHLWENKIQLINKNTLILHVYGLVSYFLLCRITRLCCQLECDAYKRFLYLNLNLLFLLFTFRFICTSNWHFMNVTSDSFWNIFARNFFSSSHLKLKRKNIREIRNFCVLKRLMIVESSNIGDNKVIHKLKLT